LKKTIVILILCVLATTAVSADTGPGFYLSPAVAIDLGINNVFRGGAVVAQAIGDLGFIGLGLELKVDYDITFNSMNVPMLLLLCLGRDFWIGVGYTLGIGSPSFAGFTWKYGDFPNTYEIGANIFRFDLPFGSLLAQSTISYTVNGPVDPTQGVAGFFGAIAGLKATIGAGLELKLL
jgi:hypothetical protein